MPVFTHTEAATFEIRFRSSTGVLLVHLLATSRMVGRSSIGRLEAHLKSAENAAKGSEPINAVVWQSVEETLKPTACIENRLY